MLCSYLLIGAGAGIYMAENAKGGAPGYEEDAGIEDSDAKDTEYPEDIRQKFKSGSSDEEEQNVTNDSIDENGDDSEAGNKEIEDISELESEQKEFVPFEDVEESEPVDDVGTTEGTGITEDAGNVEKTENVQTAEKVESVGDDKNVEDSDSAKEKEKTDKEYKGVFTVNSSGVNVRAENKKDSVVVMILDEGTTGKVLKRGKTWTKIECDDTIGYIHTEFIDIE